MTITPGLSYILIVVLLQELTVLPYRLQPIVLHGFIRMSPLFQGYLKILYHKSFVYIL